jgi:hypothetical protein
MAMCKMELALLERQVTIKAGERLSLIIAILAQCFDSIHNFLVNLGILVLILQEWLHLRRPIVWRFMNLGSATAAEHRYCVTARQKRHKLSRGTGVLL